MAQSNELLSMDDFKSLELNEDLDLHNNHRHIDGEGAESHSFKSSDDDLGSDGGSQSSAHDDGGKVSKNPIQLLVLTQCTKIWINGKNDKRISVAIEPETQELLDEMLTKDTKITVVQAENKEADSAYGAPTCTIALINPNGFRVFQVVIEA